jgi:hypothetical protein
VRVRVAELDGADEVAIAAASAVEAGA